MTRLRLRLRDRPFRTFRRAANPYDSFVLLSPSGSECGSLGSSASVEEENAAPREDRLADSDSEASVALSLVESEAPDPGLETPSNFRAGDPRILYWIEGVANGVPIPAIGFGHEAEDQATVVSCETCDSFCGYCCHGADCKCGCRRRLSPWGLSDIEEEEECGAEDMVEGKKGVVEDAALEEDLTHMATNNNSTPTRRDSRSDSAQTPSTIGSIDKPLPSLPPEATAKDMIRRLVFAERNSESTHGGLDDQTSTIENTPPQTPTQDVVAYNWDTSLHLLQSRVPLAPGQFEDAIESPDDVPPPASSSSLRRKAASQQLRQQARLDGKRRGERNVTW